MAHSAVLMIFKNLKVSYNALASVKKNLWKIEAGSGFQFPLLLSCGQNQKIFPRKSISKNCKITEWAFIDIFGLSVDGYSMKKSKCLSLQTKLWMFMKSFQ